MRFLGTTVLVPKAYGATLLSTVPIRILARVRSETNLWTVSICPELYDGVPFVERSFRWDDPAVFETAIHDRNIVDLTETLSYQPHRRNPRRHLLDLLCARAGIANDGCGIDYCLWPEDIAKAAVIMRLGQPHNAGRPIIVIASRASSRNKEWPIAYWQELIARMGGRARWLHVGARSRENLPDVEYLDTTPRLTVAVAALADIVISPDTFLLHAAAATRAKGRAVISLLGSTHPEAVSHPGVDNQYSDHLECQPCGRPYHPTDVARTQDGAILRWKNGKARKWECEHVRCLEGLSTESVAQALEKAMVAAPSRASELERTVVLVKPDAVAKGYAEDITAAVLACGLKVKRQKSMTLGRRQAETLYTIHRSEAFYEELITFMSSGRSHALVVEGPRALSRMNLLCGDSVPTNASLGTLRRRFGTCAMKNAVHSSGSARRVLVEEALLGLTGAEG